MTQVRIYAQHTEWGVQGLPVRLPTKGVSKGVPWTVNSDLGEELLAFLFGEGSPRALFDVQLRPYLGTHTAEWKDWQVWGTASDPPVEVPGRFLSASRDGVFLPRRGGGFQSLEALFAPLESVYRAYADVIGPLASRNFVLFRLRETV